MAKSPMKKPAKGKAGEAEAPPDVERHDEVYFRHAKGPKVGRVLSRGEHGCVIEADGERHKVYFKDIHGHKKRISPEVKVVDQGEDGMLVEDRSGKRRFVSDVIGAEEPGVRPMAKSMRILIMGTTPELMAKAMGRDVKGRPGLALQNVTDRAGHQTKRWKKTGVEPHKERPAGKADDVRSPKHGLHNVEPGHSASFKLGTVTGSGKVTDAGEKGATIRDAEGHDHKVPWEHVTEAKPESDKPKSNKRDPRHVEGSTFHALPPGGIEALAAEVDKAVQAADMGALFASPDTEKLPVKVSSSLKSWDEISGRMDEAQSGLQEMLDGIGNLVGARDVGKFNDQNLAGEGIVYGLGPPKTQESAARKVNDKYGGDWSKLGDAVRASIGFDSVDQLRDGIEKLKAAGLKLATKPDNKFVNPTDAGYRDMNLNFEMPNGVVGELQLHLKPILRAKSEGHKDYDVTRLLSAKEKNDPPLSPDEAQELRDRLMKQRVLYTRAMQEALTHK